MKCLNDMKMKIIILLAVAVVLIPLSSRAVITNCYDFFGSLQCNSQLDPVERQRQFFQDQQQQIRDWELRQQQQSTLQRQWEQLDELRRQREGQNFYNQLHSYTPSCQDGLVLSGDDCITPSQLCKNSYGQFSYWAGTKTDGKYSCDCLPDYEFKNNVCIMKIPALTPTPASDNLIPEGALIRIENGIDIYIVKYVGSKKFKRLVLSPSVFNNYGHLKWENIQYVSQAVLDSYKTSDLVRAVGDDNIYWLYAQGDTGQKRLIKNSAVLTRFGLDSDSIYEINSFDRESYVDGLDLE